MRVRNEYTRAALLRLHTESGIAVLLVEQHAALALELTREEIFMDRGEVVWCGASADPSRDAEKLEHFIGVAAKAD